MPLLTVDEAADFLKVSTSFIHARKDVPRHRLPGSRAVRFVAEELLEWAKSGAKDLTVADSAGHHHKHNRNPRYRP